LSLDERAFFLDRCDKYDAGARFFFPAADATDREAFVDAGFFFFDFSVYFFVHALQWF
jgi:hypothetical protein